MGKASYSEVFILDHGASSSVLTGYHIKQRKCKVILNRDGYETTPSYVRVKNPLVLSEYGEKARDCEQPQEVLRSPKRHIGKSEWVTNDSGTKFVVEHAVNAYIYKLLKDMEKQAGQKIPKVLLTVPVCWGYDRKEIYRKILEINRMTGEDGVQIVGMLEESVAAGMAFIDSIKDMRCVSVCDIGGNTTDLAVMDMKMKDGEGSIKVKASDGDEAGGDDWTEYIFAALKQKVRQKGISFEGDVRFLKKLYEESETIKTTMLENADEEYVFRLFSNTNRKNVKVTFTKMEYYDLAERFWKKLKPVLDRFAQRTKSMGVDVVLLVGGTCSNPYFREKLRQYYTTGVYQNVRVISHKEKTAVALGAANYAHWVFDEKKKINIENQTVFYQEDELPDVTDIELLSSESIGVKALCSDSKYVVSNIIRKGQALPSAGERVYGIVEDGQQWIHLNLYSNRSEYPTSELSGTQYIGQLVLDLRGMQVKRKDPVHIKLKMNTKGMLEVYCSVKDQLIQKQEFRVREM